jgi:N4-gp56 family major capsid protein
MGQNLAAKYSDKVDERYKLKSLTDSAVNQDYDWAGVNTVNVYNVSTPSMNNYTRSGSTRYGSATDLSTTITSYTLSRDRSFTFVIDRGDWSESMYVTESGKALARTIDEVVVPEIDQYRLSVMNISAHSTKQHSTDVSAISTSNAYSVFLNLQQILDDNKVPINGRVMFIKPTVYNSIKRDSSFSKNADLAYSDLKNGQIGEVDGVPLIKVPSSYFPYDTDMILVHPSAVTAPLKLEDYKVHDNPPGINGYLVEGRIIYDAFVLTAKTGALAIHSVTPSS